MLSCQTQSLHEAVTRYGQKESIPKVAGRERWGGGNERIVVERSSEVSRSYSMTVTRRVRHVNCIAIYVKLIIPITLDVSLLH